MTVFGFKVISDDWDKLIREALIKHTREIGRMEVDIKVLEVQIYEIEKRYWEKSTHVKD